MQGARGWSRTITASMSRKCSATELHAQVRARFAVGQRATPATRRWLPIASDNPRASARGKAPAMPARRNGQGARKGQGLSPLYDSQSWVTLPLRPESAPGGTRTLASDLRDRRTRPLFDRDGDDKETGKFAPLGLAGIEPAAPLEGAVSMTGNPVTPARPVQRTRLRDWVDSLVSITQSLRLAGPPQLHRQESNLHRPV